MALDTLRLRSTPEGVELALRPAGPHARFLAWSIDVLLQAAALVAFSLLAAAFGRAGQGLLLLGVFALSWFYPVAFELLWDGSTPGKRALGLQVVHDDGTPVGPTASLLRNLVRFADFLPACYGFGLASCLLTRDSRRLGDLTAGTLVVHRESGTIGGAPAPHEPEAPPLPLSLAERRAVVGFGERVSGWGPERRTEIASQLEPLTGRRGRAGVERLLAFASWLAGRR